MTREDLRLQALHLACRQSRDAEMYDATILRAEAFARFLGASGSAAPAQSAPMPPVAPSHMALRERTPSAWWEDAARVYH